MAHPSSLASTRPTPVALAVMSALLSWGAAQAQSDTAPPPAQAGASAPQASAEPTPGNLPPVVVTARGKTSASVAGWGTVPLAQAPFQASSFGAETLREQGAQRLADITRLDPSVSNAYNSEGYWDIVAIRGYTLDNRFNFRRDGLPINAETSVPLDNKASVDILKGTSGLQAGTSAPGGIVNYVVKRPTATPLRDGYLAWGQQGSVLAAVDLSERMGLDDRIGLRINAAAQYLDPQIHSDEGRRRLLAMAYDWQLTPSTQLEAEFETSHRRQPSVPAFSLLGSAVPTPTDGRTNLNNQPWSQAVVMDANTGSLRLTQVFNPRWKFTAHGATQRLRTDDRVAFPSGCRAESNWDRYCSDGSFDLYDYRSENERRRTDALELAVHGQETTGAVGHTGSAGLLYTRVKNRFQRQAFNRVGTGNVQGTAITPADPTLTDENTQRDERSAEVFIRDALRLGPATLWLGLRHSRLERASVRTDGSSATDYSQGITTPWLAGSFQFTPATMAYASWGQGAESEVTPNRARYTNAGEALPTLKSRQTELGLKHSSTHWDWSLAGFDIQRPASASYGTDCSGDTPGDTCTLMHDGSNHHRGLEAQSAWKTGPWVLQGAAQWLHARREGSQDAAMNGKQPTNVPARTLTLQTRYQVSELPGLMLHAGLYASSSRMVLPDNSVRIPGYAVVNIGTRYAQNLKGNAVVWSLGVDNLFNRQAWAESPYQYGHAYLYPVQGTRVRAAVQLSL